MISHGHPENSTKEYPVKLRLGYRKIGNTVFEIYVDINNLKWYKCRICGAHFASQEDAEGHSKTHRP